ncbi:CD59 glycoprotein [Pseudophryne corroboree]|uniref:CD59 glycoprotein n=1 Tax=Pseudophryne corroboree TaxID=495146 RepID=UPI0030821F0B
MNSTGSVALSLALVLLTLCATGHALECYKCDYTADKCQTKEICGSNQDACMTLSRTAVSVTRYGCRALDRCTPKAVKEDLQISNFEISCCQRNLCNSRSPISLPMTALVLSLATALLLIFSL